MGPLGVWLYWRYLTLSLKVPKNDSKTRQLDVQNARIKRVQTRNIRIWKI